MIDVRQQPSATKTRNKLSILLMDRTRILVWLWDTMRRGISMEQDQRMKMTTELAPKAPGSVALDHILGSAVVLNWDMG